MHLVSFLRIMNMDIRRMVLQWRREEGNVGLQHITFSFAFLSSKYLCVRSIRDWNINYPIGVYFSINNMVLL